MSDRCPLGYLFIFVFFRGFKFKRPGNSLSLSKPKPPGSIISSEVQKNVPKPVSAGIAQNRHNATSSFNSNFGRTENKGGNNPAPRPVNYGVTLNKNDNNRQGSGPGPISFGMPSSKDEDITFVSQTKPLRELSNVHEGGQRKMIEKDKKVITV